MNGSIFLMSRFSIQSSGLKSRPSPAMRAGNSEASKRVISPIPDRPAIRASQFFSTPTPSGVTRPTPVTTTRRSSIRLIRALHPPSSSSLIIYQKRLLVENVAEAECTEGSRLLVDLTSVRDSGHIDGSGGIVNDINYPVVTDANPPFFIAAL